MANLDTPFGLRPVRHRNGAPYSGAVNPYYIPAAYATALFAGDPVIITGTTNTARVTAPQIGDCPPGTLPEINKAATAGPISGVIVAFAVDPDNLSLQYNPASNERIALVADDPELLYEVQEDSVGGALAEVSVGLNAPLTFGAGDTVSGRSGAELDSSLAAGTAGLPLRIERLVNREDNEIGNQAKWLVSIVDHQALVSAGI